MRRNLVGHQKRRKLRSPSITIAYLVLSDPWRILSELRTLASHFAISRRRLTSKVDVVEEAIIGGKLAVGMFLSALEVLVSLVEVVTKGQER